MNARVRIRKGSSGWVWVLRAHDARLMTPDRLVAAGAGVESWQHVMYEVQQAWTAFMHVPDWQELHHESVEQ